jgi:hypothetical protein
VKYVIMYSCSHNAPVGLHAAKSYSSVLQPV